MSVKGSWLKQKMENLAPICEEVTWDNEGIIVGRETLDINKILICLDATDNVVDEAISIGANAIVSHHPFIFDEIKKINDSTSLGKRILKVIEKNILVYSAHINFDVAIGGTNDAIFELLGLTKKENLYDTEFKHLPLGRMGTLSEKMCLKQFASFVRGKLGTQTVNYIGDGDMEITKVGIGAGGCGHEDYFSMAKDLGCDVFVTGDVKHHPALAAKELGIGIVDATHFGTEIISLKNIQKYLQGEASNEGTSLEVILSRCECSPFNYI